ncbi:efflux RND transporter periplasmic adaptor subunit [Engelhardtia mirabilis]|uniref:Multidrug resistance protein MdtN n=1 Tax=Engelhardtia mirabilis TaxID=2528011 RepID=A0A518BQZ8_9BACT|nr:Multidrug resistance protein MdtN [Planctomycetes bacterium Pla133]QDV03724.1 Multidrug resistance protein MdtN [Planctomycetes bacterium Pla86]
MELDALKIERRPGRRRGPWPRRLVVLVVLVGIAVALREPIQSAAARFGAPTVELVTLERSDPSSLGALSGSAANGYVVAARRAALSADTPGRIVELTVTEGSTVKAGDLVARLYSDEYRAGLLRARADVAAAAAEATVAERDVERAEAELAAAEADIPRLESETEARSAEIDAASAKLRLAEIEVERVRAMVAERVSSQRELDQAQATADDAKATVDAAQARNRAGTGAVDSARAALAVQRAAIAQAKARAVTAKARVQAAEAIATQAQATLDKTEVRAPFDGIVVLKDAEVGEVVSPNSQGGSSARGSVATMVDLDSLEVQAEVPETSLSAVEVGRPARVFLDAYPERPYSGSVDRIWPTADRQKATVEVRVRFDTRDADLRPEMGVRVVFLDDDDIAALDAAARGETPPLLLPRQALVERGGLQGVYMVDGGVARFREVHTDGERDGRPIVVSGVQEGEQIVAAPPEGLADGDVVKVADGDQG